MLATHADSVNDATRITLYDYETFAADLPIFATELDNVSVTYNYRATDTGSHSWQAGTWFEDGIAIAQSDRLAII